MTDLCIIPQPTEVRRGAGSYTLSPKTRIHVNDEAHAVGEYLSRQLAPALGYPLEVTGATPRASGPSGIALRATSDHRSAGSEGYRLAVTERGVEAVARSAAGLFNAVQTLRQLLPPQVESRRRVGGIEWTVPQVEIEDEPRYSWRGAHLDVGRHFYPVEFLKRYVDLLALHKLNILHWHLTDDQGWRMEVPAHPKLTEIGAWRAGNGTEQRYGGFYSRRDLRELVLYAAERCVTVVPEIEMPGHAQAALAAYPHLSCTGGPFEVWTEWGVSKEVFCAGSEEVFAVLKDVLAEAMDVFPGRFLHLGGDECPKDRWRECPRCRQRLRDEGLRDEEELQSYFIRRVAGYLERQGRRLIGWDEILQGGGVAAGAAVMSWRGTEGGVAAARAGHDVVMSPHSHVYLDYKHYEGDDEPGRLGVSSLENVYSFEPTPVELSDAEAVHVLGAQANVWSEEMPTTEAVEQMVFPRLCALAEVVWSERSRRDFGDFKTRLRRHGERLEEMGVNYYRDRAVW